MAGHAFARRPRAAGRRQSLALAGGVPVEPFPSRPAATVNSLRLRFARPRRLFRLLAGEWRGARDVSFGTRLKALRNGFSSSSWLLFDLDHNDPADYLPDLAVRDFGRIRAQFRALNDKLLFARAMTAVGLRCPSLFGFITGSAVVPFGDSADGRDAGAWLATLVLRVGRVVLKPVAGGFGYGIVFLRDVGGRIEANGVEVDPATLGSLASRLDQYLVTEHVRQADYARSIFPATTNTVRILTLWDRSESRPFLAAAAHRFGSSRTGLVDNFRDGRGGLSANVDIATGVLGPATQPADDLTRVWHERHPDTGAAIAGIAVPHWAETADAALRAATSFPEAPLVGWDLVVTDSGPCFIEGNAPPVANVWQVHGGLLRETRSREFFEAFGLVRRRRRPAERTK